MIQQNITIFIFLGVDYTYTWQAKHVKAATVIYIV